MLFLQHHVLLPLGNFNARDVTDHPTWERVIHLGLTGVGKCNNNDLLLLKKCAEHYIRKTCP